MKRAFDLLFGLAGIILLSPIFLALALIVKFSSAGPVFFAQERVGRHGVRFRIWKFRSMVDRAEEKGTSVTASGDPRITRVGRWLRRTKLDELPQLFNIVKGEMSFVGPRPDVPEIVDGYTPDMRRILSIRPGMTSVATLHLRDEEGLLARVPNPDEFYAATLVPLKVRLAMEHVDRRSLLFDLWILALTVWMVCPMGRWWPVREHPLVTQLRDEINRMAIRR